MNTYTFGVLCNEFTKQVRNYRIAELAIHSLYFYYNYIFFGAAVRGYPTSIINAVIKTPLT